MYTYKHRLFVICTWTLLCQTNYYECRSLIRSCPNKYISCPCGNTTDKVTIAVKQCQVRDKPFQCLPCDFKSDTSRCSYKSCEACPSATTSCANCTDKIDCRLECRCQNGGSCLPNGKCACPSSYHGRLCEIQSLNSYSAISHTNVKRQATDKITCIAPSNPENGVALTEVTVFEVGDAVKYKCSEGFTMIGSGTRHCNGNGKWAGERPTCEKLCSFPILTSQEGLMYTENPGRTSNLLDTSGSVVLFEIEFKCTTGYNIVGSIRMRCTSGGKWDRDPPKCVKSDAAIQCPSPKLANGKQDPAATTTFEVASIVTFTCDSGYRLSGEFMAVCTESGTWAPKLPTCVSLSIDKDDESPTTTTTISTQIFCPKPEDLQYGTITMKLGLPDSMANRPADMFDVGTSVEYTCNHPYVLEGQTEQFCLASGHWSGQNPKCSPVCGKGVEQKTPQVINGTVAKENGYPWQVAITSYLSRAEFRYIHCGGVVISEKWVLTAAHCITNTRTRDLMDKSTFLLFFGKQYADRNLDNNDVTSRKVSQLVLHPKYDPWTFDSDLALLLLEKLIFFNNLVSPLCLPDPNSMITFQEGQEGVVTGWGNTDNKGTAAVVLMKIDLPIVDSKKCEDSYRKHNFKTTVTDNMFCAGESEGGKNTCQGDSGGAMAFLEKDRYVLEGIVSWGNTDDCAAAGFYGGFVRVRNFVPWIRLYI